MDKARAFFIVCAGLFHIALVSTALVCSVAAVAAQDSVAVQWADPSSVRSLPYPERRTFFITNAGAYGRMAGDLGRGGPVRVIVDWGAMVNRSPKHAVGGSWFIASDEVGVSSGPVLRWRRWLGPTSSLDVAVGTPITGTQVVRPGSVLGLVKYNPVEWFGLAARPELVRHGNYGFYDDQGKHQYVASGMKARLYLGAEFGSKRGLVIGAITVGAVALLAGAIAASGGIL